MARVRRTIDKKAEKIAELKKKIATVQKCDEEMFAGLRSTMTNIEKVGQYPKTIPKPSPDATKHPKHPQVHSGW